jgi:hypothetical protein
MKEVIRVTAPAPARGESGSDQSQQDKPAGVATS